jgi:hypothetical protein
MRAINHALTGSIIGLVIGKPAIAVPVALVSHYICDVIPHHGYGANKAVNDKWMRSRAFRRLLYADAALCACLVLVLFLFKPQYWFLAAVCAFVAAAPDLLSINLYSKTLGDKQYKRGWYTKFAGKIQWFERPIGAVVEIAWFIAAVAILVPLL